MAARMLALSLALMSMLAVAPAAASAARLPLPEITQVARAHWPGSPCAGRETILRGADAAPLIDRWSAEYGFRVGGLVLGACTVAIAPYIERDPWTFCGTLIHEFGHLAGHVHSDDVFDVMAPKMAFAPPECDRFIRKRWDRRYLRRMRAAWLLGRI